MSGSPPKKVTLWRFSVFAEKGLEGVAQCGFVHAPALSVFPFVSVAVGAFEVALLRDEQIQAPDIFDNVLRRAHDLGRWRLAAVIRHERVGFLGAFPGAFVGERFAGLQASQGSAGFRIDLEDRHRLGKEQVVLVALGEYMEILGGNHDGAPMKWVPGHFGLCC